MPRPEDTDDRTISLSRVSTQEILARAVDPCALAIFGASGDLTKRKLVPALHHLALAGLLPHQFGLVGLARADLTSDQFRAQLDTEAAEFLGKDFRPDIWADLRRRIH